MKTGYCAPLKTDTLDTAALWSLLREHGYDYIECAASQLLALDGNEMKELQLLREREGLNIYAVNCFIPAGMKLCGSEARGAGELREYVAALFAKMNSLGAKIIVFGSGTARTIPDGVPVSSAMEQLRSFLNICADAGERHDIITVIEPLNRSETNVFNTLSAGAAAVRELDCRYVRLLADSFHMSEEGESPDLGEQLPLLAHAHIAEQGSRLYPGSTGGEYVAAFLSALKKSRYTGGISVECKSVKLADDIRLSAAFLRDKGFMTKA